MSASPAVQLYDSTDAPVGTSGNPLFANNQQSNVQLDYDTGVGTQLMTLFGIALPASGGAVAGGTTANPLNVVRSDGAGNTAPAGDVAARASFVEITDGTHVMPTMDAAARAGFVEITDGTHVMPTMDAAARAGYQHITDGTNTLVVNPDGSINVTTSGSPSNVFRVDMYEAAVGAKTYFVAIQASNASTDYKHTAGTKIKLHKLFANVIKSSNKDQWDVDLGVVLDITGVHIMVAWLLPGTMRLRDTAVFIREQNIDFENDLLDLTVAANALTKVAAGRQETTVDLTSASTINDVAGNPITPAIGDLIMRVAPVGSVSGTVLVEQHIAYEVAA